jgi:broad specificity phosphatase PhoE
MGIITYWLLGLFLSLIVVAGLYDYWQQRRVDRSLPPELTKAVRRQARRAARARRAHDEDIAKRPSPPSVF